MAASASLVLCRVCALCTRFRPAFRLSSMRRLKVSSCFMVGMRKDFLYEPCGVTERSRKDKNITVDSFGVENRSRAAVAAHQSMLEWTSPVRQFRNGLFRTAEQDNLCGGISMFRTLTCISQDEILDGRVRRLSMAERVANKKEIKLKREMQKKRKQMRWAVKLKKASMSHEEKLLARIERGQKKLSKLQQELKKFELPPLPMPKHVPVSLTAEECKYLQKMGQKSESFNSAGTHGISEVVHNMHLHWKQHRLVNVHCAKLPLEEIKVVGQHLARLSGGTVVDIQDGETVVFFRGKRHMRSKDTVPEDPLSKEKVLLKSKCEQAIQNHERDIQQTEQELKSYRAHMARETANMLPPKDVSAQPDTGSIKIIHSFSEIRHELVCNAF